MLDLLILTANYSLVGCLAWSAPGVANVLWGKSMRYVVAVVLGAYIASPVVTFAADEQFAVPPSYSTVPIPSPEPINNVAHPLGPTSQHFLIAPRYTTSGDLTGDGLNDIAYGPSYFQYRPNQPLQIWVNLGNGKFEERTGSMIEGDIPLVGSPNNLFISDFNGDGRGDILIIEQGLEDQPPGQGTLGTNVLLLSGADGKLRDRSNQLEDNILAFNHVSSLTDVNNDGHVDIVLTRLGGFVNEAGVYFLFGDSKGNFTKSSSGTLPSTVEFPVSRTDSLRHQPGSASVCDMDGDGRGDLVTGSYNADGDGGHTIRVFQQQPNGKFIESAKMPMAATVALVPNNAAEPTRKLGAHQLLCGKLTASGRNDIVVAWEGSRITYTQVMRNDGSFQFTDITEAALGTYEAGYTNKTGTYFPTNETQLMDFDDDGDVDIVRLTIGADERTFAGGGGFIYLNDGAGKFTPFTLSSGGKALSEAEIVDKVFGGCGTCSFVNLVFDAGGSKKKDLVLLNGFNPTPGPRVRNQTIGIRSLISGAANGVTLPTLNGPSVFSSAQASSQSFLRFFNTGTTSGIVTVSLNDGATGQALGSWDTSSIAPGAQIQVPITTIETALKLTFKPSYYTMSVQSGISGYFQHVLYRPADGTLTNLSTCKSGITAVPSKLSGVHSSILRDGFPSSVVVSNTGATAQSATLGIYDARDGTKMGTYSTSAVPADGQLVLDMTVMEADARVSPGTDIYHYVIQAEGAFDGYLQHLVNNTRVGVITDMTTVCSLDGVSPPTTTAPLRVGTVFSTAQSSSQSFLRFFSTGQGGKVTATLRNFTTGQFLGEWVSPSIAPGSQVQYDIGTVEAALSAGTSKPAYYTMSFRSEFAGYFQHVLYRPTDGTLTNLSTCATGVTADQNKLSGVHSTLLGSNFPSSVVISNTKPSAVPVFLAITDSNTGTNLGVYNAPLVPGYAQIVVPMSAIETGIGKSPTPVMYHYAISAVGPSASDVFLQHLVNNSQFGVITDMTTVCTLPKT